MQRILLTILLIIIFIKVYYALGYNSLKALQTKLFKKVEKILEEIKGRNEKIGHYLLFITHVSE